MRLANLFKPTKGKLAFFILLVFVFAAIDTQFLLFINSPLIYNFWTSGAIEFVVWILIVPYLLSVIIPPLFFGRFRKPARTSSLGDFMSNQRSQVQIVQKQDLTAPGDVTVSEELDKIEEAVSTQPKPKAKKVSKPRPKKKPTRKSKPAAKKKAKRKR